MINLKRIAFILVSFLLCHPLLLAYNRIGIASPVIPGFHPDPSVCRVGNDYYLVNSTFQYFPGVPIFKSSDMKHWRQIGNVLDRASQLPLANASSWTGICAPTIRHHDGRFYMITTNVGGGGNFMVTAEKPEGPWSEPIWLSQQGIDPSLYFEDGKCYMVSNPDNPIFTHCRMAAQSSQVQGTGHGDLVEDADGQWWMVFLGFRFYNGSYHHLGRETFMAPVVWSDGGWPVVNGGQPLADVGVNSADAASYPSAEILNTAANGFALMGHEWLFIQNPDSSKYEHRGSALRLHATESTLTDNRRPTFVGRRQQHASMTATATVDASLLQPGSEAGIAAYQINDGHCEVMVGRDDSGKYYVATRYRLKSLEKTSGKQWIDNPKVTLAIKSTPDKYEFLYGNGKESLKSIGTIEPQLMSTEVVGGFTGVILGIYAQGQGSADFGRFDYNVN